MIGLPGIMCRIFVFSAAVKPSGEKDELHLPLCALLAYPDLVVMMDAASGAGDRSVVKLRMLH